MTPLHLDYATRDYDGFRQLMLSVIDRQGTAWTERAAADVGVMVVELLAYELDRLAYAGDRVAEESFLATARRRESARNHAALGDHALDRGNATRGFQWFQLAAGTALALPARTPVANPIDPRDPEATRLWAETLDAVSLDARRNAFVLARSALAGSRVLRFDGGQPDLRALGFAPGMPLIVGAPVVPGSTPSGAIQLASGEVVRIAAVLPGGVELAQPLQHTWPGGAEGAWLLGNVVEIRRGLTSPWTEVGLGGAGLGELANDELVRRRFDVVRRLRAEVEDAREAWIGRPVQRGAWTAASRELTALRKQLATQDLSAYDTRDAAQRAALEAVIAPLTTAADRLRGMLDAVGREVPAELAASQRVAVPRQLVELDAGDQPVLWMDGDGDRGATLQVAVTSDGVSSRWTERPDLLRSAADDPHYVVEIDGNSNVAVRFGDGVTGAMPPADSVILARWVTGDEAGDDLRSGSLTATGAAFPAIVATSNPLPTTGGRAPEPLDGLVARVEAGLATPAIPVTAADYRDLLAGGDAITGRPGIAEAAVSEVRGAVDIVIRPGAGVAAAPLLDETRAWLDEHRLAGATIRVRLPRPMPIDIAIVVDVHPDVSAADLRYRVQRALTAAFADDQPRLLGRPRTRAELYGLIEGIPGVRWSQLVVFDLAGRTGVQDELTAAPDQVLRCAASDEQPAGGQITIWAARRFALQLRVTYPTLDTRPELAAIRAVLPGLLSGPASIARDWTSITAARITAALAGVFTGFTVTVTRLIVDRRAVDEVELADHELPILDTATIVDGGAPR